MYLFSSSQNWNWLYFVGRTTPQHYRNSFTEFVKEKRGAYRHHEYTIMLQLLHATSYRIAGNFRWFKFSQNPISPPEEIFMFSTSYVFKVSWFLFCGFVFVFWLWVGKIVKIWTLQKFPTICFLVTSNGVCYREKHNVPQVSPSVSRCRQAGQLMVSYLPGFSSAH